ncbi:hypothetical protein TRFO_14025 [Tritrichomonas foetus]|uniref:Uncharacterized protein n=1 Tax=Tritrichomonas foetus TaxID=1144522 RepID=A0A1J4L0H4_9EUKA|nr:hypothetical protein TRFO_14025 [Tritrichomonas foetus]|eukprot:OHT15436.1 hypothetical protein TRFO_14025 [Tritrichomonas foetus]
MKSQNEHNSIQNPDKREKKMRVARFLCCGHIKPNDANQIHNQKLLPLPQQNSPSVDSTLIQCNCVTLNLRSNKQNKPKKKFSNNDSLPQNLQKNALDANLTLKSMKSQEFNSILFQTSGEKDILFDSFWPTNHISVDTILGSRVPKYFDIVRRGNLPGICLRNGKIELL